MFDWFNQKDKNKEFKLWQMSESQKFYYARYLGLVGMISINLDTAISYLTKSINILDKLEDDASNHSLKFNLISHISALHMFLGNITLAEKFLKKIEELAKQGIIQEADLFIIYLLKSALFNIQGKYNEALECIDKMIKIFNDPHINDPYFTGAYMLRAQILNSLDRYQEAYIQAQQVYNIHKHIKNENNEIFANVYIKMARSELGLGKVDKASEYINKAIPILLADENRNPEVINYSKDSHLAVGYVVQGTLIRDKNYNSYPELGVI
ncbi:tetratricopeptide repeat protein [Candidatus Tisiphia endosymbiont of Ditula angustiorana]|uniref:tetratricopeptide repeat protein n=1 Tax=Candidatus Tisiphia endosymbiont of Ditula angustiorana TaxID=3066272 RepID=UPI00312CA9D8